MTRRNLTESGVADRVVMQLGPIWRYGVPPQAAFPFPTSQRPESSSLGGAVRRRQLGAVDPDQRSADACRSRSSRVRFPRSKCASANSHACDRHFREPVSMRVPHGHGSSSETGPSPSGGVRRQIAVRTYLTRETFCSGSGDFTAELEPATIDACTSSTSSVARTAHCTPAMRKTRVRANGRTTAAAARSTPRAVVRCSWCIKKRSGLWGRHWHASTWLSN